MAQHPIDPLAAEAVLFDAARVLANRVYGPADPPVEVIVRTRSGGRLRYGVPPCAAPPAAPPEPFVPSEFQQRILAALEGQALRSDPLGDAVDDRRRLFRHPGGVRELQEHGLVEHHSRLGYYRPDVPPPDLPH